MGVQAVDVVELAGVKATAAVMLATEEAKDPFLNAPFDGIMGIARKTGEIDGNEFNVLSAMAAANAIEKNIISFYFTKKPTTDMASDAGAVLLGGVDNRFYEGDITYHPVEDKSGSAMEGVMWTIAITNFQVANGTNVCEGGCVGVIDTGTSLLVTDQDKAVAINRELKIGSDCSGYEGGPEVHIKFGGSDRVYPLAGHSVALMAQDQDGRKVCEPAIRTMEPENQGIPVEALGAAQQADSVVPEDLGTSMARAFLKLEKEDGVKHPNALLTKLKDTARQDGSMGIKVAAGTAGPPKKIEEDLVKTAKKQGVKHPQELLRAMEMKEMEIVEEALEEEPATEEDVSDKILVASTRRLMGSRHATMPPPEEGKMVRPPQPSKWEAISSGFGAKPVIIIGDIFLRQYFSVFDNSDPASAKVGFATAKTVDLATIF